MLDSIEAQLRSMQESEDTHKMQHARGVCAPESSSLSSAIVQTTFEFKGFSFGGILAHLCAIHLWSLSQGICPELLEKNLLCITFGQPIIPLPRVPNFSNRVTNKSRFHAVYVDDDIIPRMMRYLDPTSTKLKNPTSGLPEKFKCLQNPEKVK